MGTLTRNGLSCKWHNKSKLYKRNTKQPPKVFHIKRCSLKISQNSQENTCAKVSFLIKFHASVPGLKFKLAIFNFRSSHWRCSVKQRVLKTFKKETLAQMFSCEFCENLKNTCFIEHLLRTPDECLYGFGHSL